MKIPSLLFVLLLFFSCSQIHNPKYIYMLSSDEINTKTQTNSLLRAIPHNTPVSLKNCSIQPQINGMLLINNNWINCLYDNDYSYENQIERDFNIEYNHYFNRIAKISNDVYLADTTNLVTNAININPNYTFGISHFNYNSENNGQIINIEISIPCLKKDNEIKYIYINDLLPFYKEYFKKEKNLFQRIEPSSNDSFTTRSIGVASNTNHTYLFINNRYIPINFLLSPSGIIGIENLLVLELLDGKLHFIGVFYLCSGEDIGDQVYVDEKSIISNILLHKNTFSSYVSIIKGRDKYIEGAIDEVKEIQVFEYKYNGSYYYITNFKTFPISNVI